MSEDDGEKTYSEAEVLRAAMAAMSDTTSAGEEAIIAMLKELGIELPSGYFD